jgi:cytochrome c peroxidase
MGSARRKSVILMGVLLGVINASSHADIGSVAQADVGRGTWELRHDCPSSFENANDGTCAFRSLYQLYSAPQNHGGLRVPLPQHRDGFTPEQIDLGRYLFFDPILSEDSNTSCASCHNPQKGFSDGEPVSLGRGASAGPDGLRRGGAKLRRSAPTLWNVGFLRSFYWDGRSPSLEDQASGPLFSADEMGTTPTALLKRLNAIPAYRHLFTEAFGRRNPGESAITLGEVTQALAAFETSLVSVSSRYDRYAHGETGALSSQEVAGLNIFRGFVARCSQCHVPPLFTDGELVVVGAPAAKDGTVDRGAAETTHNVALTGAFKVPTLRNIAKTAPYFNAGQFATLKDVVDFYNGGRGHAVPHGATETIHWHVSMAKDTLSAAEVQELVAFLGTLTDESLMPQIPRTLPSGIKPALPQGSAALAAPTQRASAITTSGINR